MTWPEQSQEVQAGSQGGYWNVCFSEIVLVAPPECLQVAGGGTKGLLLSFTSKPPKHLFPFSPFPPRGRLMCLF